MTPDIVVGGLGIDLSQDMSRIPEPGGFGDLIALPDGVTANDLLDVDEGSNNLQNSPVIDEAEFEDNEFEIEGELRSEPDKPYLIEALTSQEADESGHGEGETFVAGVRVTTDDDGEAEFEIEGDDDDDGDDNDDQADSLSR